MRALSAPRRVTATEIDRPLGNQTDRMVEDVLTELAWRLWGALAPSKIAAELKCHTRTIERYMEGKREWSGEAVAIIVEELLRRHRLRNVKVAVRR